MQPTSNSLDNHMNIAKKVSVIGGGSWGSALTVILGENVAKYPSDFHPVVKVWILDEQVNKRSLVDQFNELHENVKYLPSIKLPKNVVANRDLKECAQDADILILSIPQQFLVSTCKKMVGLVKKDAVAVSVVKGIDMADNNELVTLTSVIKKILNVRTAALMGANLALEVAKKEFCEATIGVESINDGSILKHLFETKNFSINIAHDLPTVELCGALKNIVACAAGMVDGLNLGSNTKAAVIRIGFVEMTRFIRHFHPQSNLATFFESCGLADLITSCYGGRNRKVCEAFAKTGRKIPELEKELLGGQKLQGPQTAEQLCAVIEANHWSDHYPLFVAVHKICSGQWMVSSLIEHLRKHVGVDGGKEIDKDFELL